MIYVFVVGFMTFTYSAVAPRICSNDLVSGSEECNQYKVTIEEAASFIPHRCSNWPDKV